MGDHSLTKSSSIKPPRIGIKGKKASIPFFVEPHFYSIYHPQTT